MIQSSFVENRSVCLRVLSDDQIWEIQQAAFDVLEKTGCNVLHDGAIALLKQAGAVVKDERVKIPRYIEFVDEYPMTVTGKVQKFVMRERMAERLQEQHAS